MASVMKKKLYLALFSLAVAVIGLAVWYFVDGRVSPVIDGRIYRSNRLSSDDLESVIRDRNIRTILNLTGRFANTEWYVREHELARKYGVAIHDFALSPSELPTFRELQEILKTLAEAEKPLLIHCRRGADRTGMVSAMALALEQDPPLATLKKQFSWRYGVFPWYQSIGPLLFQQYEGWLGTAGRVHGRDALLDWIENGYVDHRGNLLFEVDAVNEVFYSGPGLSVTVRDDRDRVVLGGWAFDARRESPVGGLTVLIDGTVSAEARFVYNRTDVAKYFGLKRQAAYTDFRIGWVAEFDRKALGDGCHTITLRNGGSNGIWWDVPVKRSFCIETP